MDSPFRTAERYWKSRTAAPDFSTAFDHTRIRWEPSSNHSDGRTLGTWDSTPCYRLPLQALGETGLGTSWKGKGTERDSAYAILFPSIPGMFIPVRPLLTLPGLVLIPGALPPSLQRKLALVSFQQTAPPNLSSQSVHYEIPSVGLWNAVIAGQGDRRIARIDQAGVGVAGPRKQVDFDPVTEQNWEQVNGRGANEVPLPVPVRSKGGADGAEAIETVLHKLRWVTIGWQYDVRLSAPLSHTLTT